MWVASRFLMLSLVAAALATLTSLAGILGPEATYARESRAWAVQAAGQDWANLLVVALLVASVVLLRSGWLRAVHVWLGCLLYLIYAFAIYAFAVHFNRFFLAYVAVLGLSFFSLVGALAALPVSAVTESLREHPARLGAGVLLILIGVLFGVLWLAEDVPHTVGGSIPASLTETGLWTNPVHVLDLAFLLPAMLTVGVLLRRQHAWGLLLGIPMLVFAVTMGIGILCLFALQAAAGLPVPAPAVAMVGLLVAASAGYSVALLRHPSQGRR